MQSHDDEFKKGDWLRPQCLSPFLKSSVIPCLVSFSPPHPGVAGPAAATTTPILTDPLSLAARRRHRTKKRGLAPSPVPVPFFVFDFFFSPSLFFNRPHPDVADPVAATTTPSLTVPLSLAARRRHRMGFPAQGCVVHPSIPPRFLPR